MRDQPRRRSRSLRVVRRDGQLHAVRRSRSLRAIGRAGSACAVMRPGCVDSRRRRQHVRSVRSIDASGQKCIRAAPDDVEAAANRSSDVVAGEPHPSEVGPREDIIHAPNVVSPRPFGNPLRQAVDTAGFSGAPVTHRSPPVTYGTGPLAVRRSSVRRTAVGDGESHTEAANGTGSAESRSGGSRPLSRASVQWTPGITGRIDSIVRDPSAACVSTASSDPMDCSSVSSARVGRMSR